MEQCKRGQALGGLKWESGYLQVRDEKLFIKEGEFEPKFREEIGTDREKIRESILAEGTSGEKVWKEGSSEHAQNMVRLRTGDEEQREECADSCSPQGPKAAGCQP